MLYFSANTLIENLPHSIFKKLATELNSNNEWESDMEYLGLFDRSQINPCLQTQGEFFLNNLISKTYTINVLYQLLKECRLFKALSYICTEPIEIQQQPMDNLQDNKIIIKRADKLSLQLNVFGIPLPKCNWYRNDILLPGQVSSTLNINSYKPCMEGRYYCIATQILEDGSTETKTSNSFVVETLPECCTIIKKPDREICIQKGETFSLEVKANGYPAPKYEWTHENKVLNKEIRNCLKIKKSDLKNEGTYRCRIYNGVSEKIVITNVTIIQNFIVYKARPVEKIAFLIANQHYDNFNHLTTPIVDVKILAPILESWGFLVLIQENLKLSGMVCAMKKFCEMSVEGGYVLFYFAGHGFQLGEKYLLPIDSPDDANYDFKDCISESQILRDILQTKPKLLVSILDMCLATPDRDKNTKIYEREKEREIITYPCSRNLIQVHSTSNGLRAYELENMQGLYVKALKKYLEQKLSVIQMFINVNAELEEQTKVFPNCLQVPELTLNVTSDYDITTPKVGHPYAQLVFHQLIQQINRSISK